MRGLPGRARVGTATPNVCGGGPDCRPSFTCGFEGGSYCGKIGDGCGKTLECSSACTKPGWVCEQSVCVGPPPGVCQARTCDPAPGARYCGKVGDDCGRALDCGDRCADLAPGWVCDPSKNACVGGPDCQRAQCTTANGGRFCGTVGDGCGGVLACGDDCSSAGPGWICDPAQGICTGGPSCQRISCTTPEGGQYCGDIGDGCGGTLKCPSTCPGSGTCVNHVCPSSSCNAACQAQKKCASGTTSIGGKVYDPAGKVPIYNVIVYVPDAPLAPIAKGATCQSCSASISGRPIATALTDATGSFRLENVPVGVDFPLVMQVGKWRRQVTIAASEISECSHTTISDPQRLRLPRKQSEGEMPKIALTVGDADRLQ